MSLAKELAVALDGALAAAFADWALCEFVSVRMAFIHLLLMPLLPPWPQLAPFPAAAPPELTCFRPLVDCNVPPVSAMIVSAFEPYKSLCDNATTITLMNNTLNAACKHGEISDSHANGAR